MNTVTNAIDAVNDESSAVDVAVIGLGPGGLAAAPEAAATGKQVLAFTDRTQYIRGQRLVLTPETDMYLRDLIDENDPLDHPFLDKLDSEYTMQTKDIERFLFRKCSHFPNITIVTINKENPVTQIGTGEMQTANFIQLQNKEKFYCRNILAADGAKHVAASILNASLNAGIEYTMAPLQERYKYHGVVQLRLKPGEKAGQPETENQTFKARLAHAKQGWKEPYFPNSYIFTNKNENKFYFAGEIPKIIFDAPQETRGKLLKKWACDEIFRKYGVSEDQLEYHTSKKSPEKDRLQALVFEMNIIASNKATYQLANGMFALIGDARRTPNYFVAHGLNDAIAGGIAFASALKTGDFKSFEVKINQMDDNVEFQMQLVSDSKKSALVRYEEKLITLLEELIDHLKQDFSSHEQDILHLIDAKKELEHDGSLTKMYEIVNTIQSTTENNDTSVLLRGYNCLTSKLEADHIMKKSADILDKIKGEMDKIYRQDH